jgi:hypothetical protein
MFHDFNILHFAQPLLYSFILYFNRVAKVAFIYNINRILYRTHFQKIFEL